ncbi:sirohydrochlorin cobaltochelatase [Desulfovibrio sp. OttesenSCG-928-F07]|nr:sirohydrochlorin cobaltochelatase [Desulfovibrio sp. OttesenSCG-928-F07]
MKHAILLAAYGAGGVHGTHTLQLFEKKVREAFPASSIRWAFTSVLMRNRLTAARKKTDSVKKALCRLGFEKYTHITVQSLHMIAGAEYEELLAEIEDAKKCGAPKHISTGLPMLHNAKDISDTASAIIKHMPDGREKHQAVIWVGHGAKHDGGLAYDKLTATIQAIDPNLFIGTLSGESNIQEILATLQQNNIKQAWLMPLLSVIGKHASQDIAGSNSDSWRYILQQHDIACQSILRGAIEYDGFASIWLNHLKEAAQNL